MATAGKLNLKNVVVFYYFSFISDFPVILFVKTNDHFVLASMLNAAGITIVTSRDVRWHNQTGPARRSCKEGTWSNTEHQTQHIPYRQLWAIKITMTSNMRTKSLTCCTRLWVAERDRLKCVRANALAHGPRRAAELLRMKMTQASIR